MQSISHIAELRGIITRQKRQGKIIGLVPTLGNLHDGHLALVAESRKQCDFTLCTVFVNPTQFGVNEDLSAYPRTLQADREKLKQAACDCLFHPDTEEIYPRGTDLQTVVSVSELGNDHCGSSRPGHFDGVTTVVNILLNICQPDRAYFGLKDYQQYLIVSKMVNDLHLPVKIIAVETERDTDGLALSSRNQYLDEAQRQQAPALYRALCQVAEQLRDGNKNFNALERDALAALQQAGFRVDYFSICDAHSLRRATENDSNLVVLAAGFLGKSRLIDNVRVTLA